MGQYGQFCPIAVTSELMAERWTPLVVRELLAGSTRFNDLRRGPPLISPSLLTRRLRSLERAGVLEREEDRSGVTYRLTDAGEELRPIIEALGAWGLRRGHGLLDPQNLDASLLMWDMRRNVALDEIPEGRGGGGVPARGEAGRPWPGLASPRRRRDRSSDLCPTDPGFEVDVLVEGHIATMAAYWLGRDEIEGAVRRGDLVLYGPRSLIRAFPSWFRRSRVSSP